MTKPRWLSYKEALNLPPVQEYRPNGIEKRGDVWYWIDETYTALFGPYQTYEQAVFDQDEYNKTI